MVKIFIIITIASISVWAHEADSLYQPDEATESDYKYEKNFSLELSEAKTSESDIDKSIKLYSESAKVQKLIQFAIKNKLASGMVNSKGKCNEYVVKALNHAGLPAWTGAQAYYAYQVKEIAPKLNYTDLLETYPEMTAKEAPKGAILVYSANNQVSCKTPKGIGCGHVELKAEDGYSSDSNKIYFVSDYSDYRPVDIDKRYKLTAIFIYLSP